MFDLSSLILKSVRTTNQPPPVAINFYAGNVKAKPNIYFLLFDEYPGYKSLKDSFAFSNDSLYDFLAKKEFKILPTFSNYNMTVYSMASMLNMQYIDKPYKPLQNTIEDDQLRIQEIKEARAIKYFRSIGYSFFNYSVFDILDQPSVKGNSFIISQATLITNKIFFYKLLHDIGWHFISGRYEVGFIKYIYMQDDRNNKFMEKKLVEINSQSPAHPRFVYAHFMLPHPPIFYDSTGNYLPNQQIFDEKSYTGKKTFLSYLKYTNKVIQNLADALCRNDPAAIIVIMSDHGYRAYNTTRLPEPMHFDNMCAVRFPDKNYLDMKDGWSNVNFFRYLFNCEFNQTIPYLSDSSIFLQDKKANPFDP